MKHHQITASMAKDIAFKLGAELNNEEAEIFADGYNAAMLQGAEPVSQTYELPQTQFEQVADLYEMQFDDGRTCAFHTDGTKAAQWLLACDGNKVQEYVRIERYQEAVIGNTPVQSPIDHGYRPECECSGCKATARICAELNNEEAEIFVDGYNAAMLKVNKNASTELPNDANLSTNSPVIPDGYALVPVEPTDEMIAAAMNCEDVLFNSDESFCVQFGNIYEAMLAAAPKPQNAPQNIPAGKSTVTPDGWISCSERMPDSKTGVLVAREFGRKGDWRMKWGTYIPGHPDAQDGWIIPGASWLPTHWMLLPEPPQQEVK